MRGHRGKTMAMIERHAVCHWVRGFIIMKSATGKARCGHCGRVVVGTFHRIAGVEVLKQGEDT
jgi:hypothetical protein